MKEGNVKTVGKKMYGTVQILLALRLEVETTVMMEHRDNNTVR